MSFNFLRASKYLVTTYPWENYLFHENSVSKYLFQKYSSSPPPGDWMVAPLHAFCVNIVIGIGPANQRCLSLPKRCLSHYDPGVANNTVVRMPSLSDYILIIYRRFSWYKSTRKPNSLNTRCWLIAGLMMAHRHWRWLDINSLNWLYFSRWFDPFTADPEYSRFNLFY